MNLSNFTRKKKLTFLSPTRKKSHIKEYRMSPLRLEASPFFSKDDNLSKFLNRRKNPIKSLSCENFDLLLYRDFKLFEQKLLLVKNQCNSELEFLLYELTNFCMQKEQKDLQIPTFVKVFFSIYTEFVNLQIENFKEADFRTLFTLIDSSKRSLLNPEFSYHEYREYWIIRVENFYKNEIQYNSINFKSPVLKSFYQKFIFILMKISRMLEIKFIIDENFKDSIKKPNHSFIRKKQMLDLDLNDLQQISQNLNKEEEDDVSQRLHDFLIQKVNYWLTISSNEIQPQEQPFLICKICLKLQPLESMKGHSYSCKELAELGKDLMDLKREFNKAEIYAKELSRKLFMEIQLDRNALKKMKSKASYEEHLLSNSISAGLNHKKPRSNTLFNHNVKYSPSIFKQKVTKENSLSKIDVKDIGFEIKTQLTDKIKSLIDSPKMFTKFNLTLEEITPAGSNTSQKAQAITIGRQKILAKYKKIGNNETLIEFLDIIKNISIIVTKNTYCHKLELKIDDVKKKLKSRPFIPGFSKVSIETLNFIGEFMLLLEKFNINGHKYIILLKNQNSDLYSSDKKKKIEKTGLSLTDEEKLINLKEKNTNKIKKALKIYSKVSSVKASINNFNPESPKDNSNIDIDESPRRLSSQSLLRDDSFLESQPSNSNYDKNLKLRPNFYSYKTGKNDKYFYDSSDDDKSLSVNESLNQKSILDSEIEDELEKLEKDKKCFSDSLSNVKVTYDFQIENKASEIGIKDFDFLQLINKGAFGRVWLVKRKQTGDFYAMKIINCLDNMNKNQLDSLKAESEVFDRIFNEFVVKSYFRFTHETFICFVLEFMYGDFSQILKTYGCLDQSTSRFYIAELILAVEHLHSLNIIHRDLKPDNMLMDDKGHIKLTDFGLSDTCMKMYKNNKRKTFIGEEQMGDFITKSDYKIPLLDNPISYICNGSQTNKKSLKHSNFIYNRIIGTPDYMSPEIINGNIGDNNNYLGKNLDWWSIGVILFEFLVGIPPFNDDTVDKIFENISNHAIPWDQIEIGYEEGQLSLEAYDLINQLLNPRVEERLGSVSVEDIKKHNFFKDFDWNEIRNRTPPIIPEIQTPDKISTRSNLNFEEKEFKEPFMIMKYQNENHIKETRKMLFQNMNTFTQTRFDLLNRENLNNILSVKETIFKKKSKETIN